MSGLGIGMLAITLAVDPTLSPGVPDIVGGEDVHGTELAQVVAIHVGPRQCSGTAVASNLVVTAAHCLAGVTQASDIVIEIGEKTSAPLAVLAATDWGTHPDFCSDPDACDDLHDLAFVVTAQPMSFDDGFFTPLATQAEFDRHMGEGEPLLLVGFGWNEVKELGQKRKVEVSLGAFFGTGGEFSAGGDGKDSCNGDSGGPALVKTEAGYRLAGVLSRGSKDCGEGGVYGVPYPALCWVRDETGVDLSAGCDACDCVALRPTEEPGCGRCQAGVPGQGPAAPAWMLGIGLASLLRRRR